MPIEPVENKDEKKEEEQQNKPLLNIQLPAPMSGDPNAPLSVGRHNASAQHNFQQVANILLTIINNQKIMGMAINQLTTKGKELEENINKVSDNIRKLLKENEDDKPTDRTDTASSDR
jgi:hypothetical protein